MNIITHYKKIILFFVLALGGTAKAQELKTIEVSYDKTVLILFGKSEVKENYVHSISIGLPESIDFSYKENKILLQALEEYFNPTNLIVELVSGKIYLYALVFNNNPKIFFFHENIAPLSEEEKVIISKRITEPEKKEQKSMNIASLEKKKDITSNKKSEIRPIEIVEVLKNKNDYLPGVGEIKYQMKVWCGGIWRNEEYYYIKLSIQNESNVDYKLGGVAIKISDKRNLKRRVKSKKNIPHTVVQQSSVAKAKDFLIFLIRIDPIAINENKKMLIDIWENDPGERRFLLTLYSNQLLNIKRLL